MELRVISMAPTAFSVSYDLGCFTLMQHEGKNISHPGQQPHRKADNKTGNTDEEKHHTPPSDNTHTLSYLSFFHTGALQIKNNCNFAK